MAGRESHKIRWPRCDAPLRITERGEKAMLENLSALAIVPKAKAIAARRPFAQRLPGADAQAQRH